MGELLKVYDNAMLNVLDGNMESILKLLVSDTESCTFMHKTGIYIICDIFENVNNQV